MHYYSTVTGSVTISDMATISSAGGAYLAGMLFQGHVLRSTVVYFFIFDNFRRLFDSLLDSTALINIGLGELRHGKGRIGP